MNFCVLGLLVEQLTGEPYEQVVHERLLTPLGISGMRLAPTYDPGPGEVEHRTVPGRNYMEVLGAAGAWVANPTDLVTILDSLDPDTPGWKPLEPETVAAMKTGVNDPLAPDRGYGMGMILYGGGAAGHTGTVESTHAMVLDRADNITWAITVSGENPSEACGSRRSSTGRSPPGDSSLPDRCHGWCLARSVTSGEVRGDVGGDEVEVVEVGEVEHLEVDASAPASRPRPQRLDDFVRRARSAVLAQLGGLAADGGGALFELGFVAHRSTGSARRRTSSNRGSRSIASQARTHAVALCDEARPGS